jgi:hypothetical protein
MDGRILGQNCPNMMHKQTLVRHRARALVLLPCFQGHRPEQQEQAGRKKGDGAARRVGLHAGAKVFVNYVNKNQQPGELNKLRPSYFMTLQRCHSNILT